MVKGIGTNLVCLAIYLRRIEPELEGDPLTLGDLRWLLPDQWYDQLISLGLPRDRIVQ